MDITLAVGDWRNGPFAVQANVVAAAAVVDDDDEMMMVLIMMMISQHQTLY